MANNKDVQKDWLLKKQDALLKEKDEYIFALYKELAEVKHKYEQVQIGYDDIIQSSSWKITSPLRNFMDKVHGSSLPVVNQKPLLKAGDKVIILSTQYALYYCSFIQSYLEKIGVFVRIITEEPGEYGDETYFVVCDEKWNKLPSVYIGIQVREIANTSNINQTYLMQLLNAQAVLDISTQNIQYFKSYSSYGNHFYYVPCDIQQTKSNSEYDSDVLCVADHESPRAKAILDDLNKKGLNYITDKSKIAKVTVVLNTYENSLLDSISISEQISKGNTILLCEKSIDSYEEDRFQDIVEFLECDKIYERIEYWLSNESQREKHLQEIERKIQNRKDTFGYYFYRFLLAMDCITFAEFYKLAGDYIQLQSDRICLSLPEDVERREAFNKSNQYNFNLFPGLRHKIGWIGCGLSYKFIMKKAKEKGYDSIIVCEDDVLFPDDFKKKFDLCMDYLDSHQNWDIFQGIMADIGDVEIKGTKEENGISYVELNHMISMVFNIYKKDMFEKIIQWDETNIDQIHNTIDRALESKDLRIITTYP